MRAQLEFIHVQLVVVRQDIKRNIVGGKLFNFIAAPQLHPDTVRRRIKHDGADVKGHVVVGETNLGLESGGGPIPRRIFHKLPGNRKCFPKRFIQDAIDFWRMDNAHRLNVFSPEQGGIQPDIGRLGAYEGRKKSTQKTNQKNSNRRLQNMERSPLFHRV